MRFEFWPKASCAVSGEGPDSDAEGDTGSAAGDGEDSGGSSRAGGVFWTLIWLVFLGYPIADIARGGFRGAGMVLAAGALALFVAVYVAVVRWDGFGKPRDPEPWRLALLGVLAVLTVGFALAYGENWTGLFIYLSVAGAMTLPPRPAALWVGVVTLGTLVVGLVAAAELLVLAFLAFLSLMVGLSVLGTRRMALLIGELYEARRELARLAVSEERLRFARDLHDLLGHSLSVVVLKSELAGRLVETDPARAGREVGDIEAVARQSLVEVRQAVAGYREQSLATELETARTSLSAAGIDVVVRADGPALPPASDALLGWAVREGTTNVLWHSRAGRCEVELRHGDGTVTLEVRDDGVGKSGGQDVHAAAPGAGSGSGYGLRGLTERVEQGGGTVESGPRPGGGFRLCVHLPVATGQPANRAGMQAPQDPPEQGPASRVPVAVDSEASS